MPGPILGASDVSVRGEEIKRKILAFKELILPPLPQSTYSVNCPVLKHVQCCGGKEELREGRGSAVKDVVCRLSGAGKAL